MRQDHIRIERLGDVIVRAEFETDHFIQFAAARGEKDDGQVVIRFQLTQGIQTVHARQADIENDKVGRGMADERQRVLGIGGGMNLVARLLEMKRQTAAHERIVVNEQNDTRHGNSLHRIGFLRPRRIGDRACKSIHALK